MREGKISVAARYAGQPATIGYLRARGVEQIRVYCAEVGCSARIDVSLADLGLSDDMLLPEVATRRNWQCARCGAGRVLVMPEWPDRRSGFNDASVSTRANGRLR